MSAQHVIPPWMLQRPWRNANPSDLRPRHQRPPWPGQVGIDDPLEQHGGPFAIFASRTDGWAAIGLWLLLAHDEWGWNTVRKMIAAFAPPTDGNDTGGYVALVCAKLNVRPDAPVDPHNRVVREALMRAIALAEAGARVQWPQEEIASALMLTEARWDSFLTAYRTHAAPVQKPVAPAETDADRLNDEQIEKIKGNPAT